MSGSDHDRRIEKFEARLRSWGGRPPSLAPAVAANRVIGRLPERSVALPWLRLAAVTAMLLLIAVATWMATPSPSPSLTVTGAESGGVVEFWLDADTPMYFVLERFGNEEGSSS